MFGNGFHHRLTFADGAGHWFFTPYIFTCFDRSDCLDGMPVWWGCYVYDVDVLAGDELAEIGVSFDVTITSLRGLGLAGAETFAVDIAKRQQLTGHAEV